MGPGNYEYAILNNIVTTKEGDYVTILEYIEQNIDKSPYKSVSTDVIYIKKILGSEFRNRGADTIYQSLKIILEKYNIRVNRSLKSKDGRPIDTITLSRF